ncbi:superoxide dismutase [Cu-Zn]-like [Parasteatoda tepidariorum]|uniref:superoxide dismutase [Cu-Zn]-like n=1 Tax=Parasteatoda tepidariorum TaxID=114398 RepID=UPI00077FDC03|nr:superoxide dismutase [Cu-Zn]-like [Parasteatoda tepidariorum]
MNLLIVFLATLVVVLNLADACDVYNAICVVRNGTVRGTIRLRSQSDYYAPVTVTGEISGLTAGEHGFHVHEYGDLSNGCMNAGAHYNPYRRNHGGEFDAVRHVGDLGNILAGWDGRALVNKVDYQLKLCGPISILGRAIVVHSGRDDLGRGGNPESLKTGNSGSRVGCCVIAVASPPTD